MARAPAAPAAPAVAIPPVIRDKAAISAASDYALNLAEMKRLEALNKDLKKTILAALGSAPKAVFGNRIVAQTAVAPIVATPNRVIDKTMIGQLIEGSPGRAGYTQIKVQ